MDNVTINTDHMTINTNYMTIDLLSDEVCYDIYNYNSTIKIYISIIIIIVNGLPFRMYG